MDDNPRFPIAPPPFDGASRRVDPGACFDWLRQGWALFMANPGIWLAAAVLVLVLTLALHIVPFIGTLAANLLTPVLAAGLLHMARRQSTGGELALNDLFAGFQERAGPLVILGVIYSVALLLIFLVVGLLVAGGIAGGTAGMVMGGGRAASLGLGMMLGGMLLGGLLAAVLSAPLFMAMWFAPALVYFNGMEPVAALKASFAACLANWLAFLVYGVILLVLGFFAALPMGLGFLVLVPVLAGALHASYRDIFPKA